MKNKILFNCLVILIYSCSNTLKKGTTEVTVYEGTNMAVSLSPDHSTLALALQGTLWTVPIKGGVATPITDAMGDCQEPSWSPDGSRIVFHSYKGGNYHIWTVKKDGTDLEQMTYGDYDDREPDWSPNGRTIVFSSDRSGNYDIWKLDLESGKLKQLTFNLANDFNPAFSPNGKQIAFVSQRKEAGVYVLENEVERIVAPSPLRLVAPSWSIDGNQLAFIAYLSKSSLFAPNNASYVYIKNIATGAMEQISKGDEDLFPFKINWLSNNSLLYTADGKIKTRGLAETKTKVIPFEASFLLNRAPYKKKYYDFDNEIERTPLGIVGPMVSPDGKKVVFTALSHIYIQEIGGKLSQITEGPHVDLYPEWSPDGRNIAYISDLNGKMDIWIQNIESGEKRLLTTKVTDDVSLPSWSPDGKQIAFYTTDYKRGWGYETLMVAEVSTGNVKLLHEAVEDPGKAGWSPDCKTLALMALKPASSRYREGFNAFLLVSDNGQSHFVSPDTTSSLGIRSQNGPVWSPDGSKIAYTEHGLLWTVPVNLRGEIIGTPKQITNELADNLSWTGDSRSLVYIATDKLKKIDIESGQSKEITIDLKWKPKLSKEDYIVQAGKLFNGKDSTYLENVDIYIKGRRIAEIKPHQKHPPGIKIVDATDKVIIPGLFEMHTHLSATVGEKLGKIWLSYGITSIREPGTDPYDAMETKESWSSGISPGPRVFFTGGLLDGSRVPYGLAISIGNANQVKMELERAKKLDYSLLKTYVRLPDSIQKILTEGSHKLGIPISSHELYPSAKYNVDALEHIAGTSRDGYSMILDANFRSYDDVIKLIGKSGMYNTPTIGMRTGYFRMASKYDELFNDDRMRRFVEPRFLNSLIQEKLLMDSSKDLKEDENYYALLSTVKSIFLLGGRITTGTDAPFAPFGSSLQAELWILVEAGLTPFQSLQAATIKSAEEVGVDKDLGSIEPGKLADMIIVDGDPLKRIQDAMKVKTVIKDGNIYKINDLLK